MFPSTIGEFLTLLCLEGGMPDLIILASMLPNQCNDRPDNGLKIQVGFYGHNKKESGLNLSQPSALILEQQYLETNQILAHNLKFNFGCRFVSLDVSGCIFLNQTLHKLNW